MCSTSIPRARDTTSPNIRTLTQEMERQFSALPGVQSVGLALYSTLEGNNWGEGVRIEGRPAPGVEDDINASWDRVSPRFFDTIGQSVVRGRGFTDQDTATSRMVAVVNQQFVKKFFPKEDPIGQHFGTFDQKYSGSYEIVGVVSDAKYTAVREEVRPMYFRPLTQLNTLMMGDDSSRIGETRSLFINSITVRFAGNPQDLESMARETLTGINPDLTMSTFRSLDSQVADNFNQERLIARLTMLFGLLALILASVGLYGLTAYSVARRTSEIGVRMAMGANRTHVLGLVMRGALLQIAIGLVIGIPVALLGGHLMASQLYGVNKFDPFTMAMAIAVLGICAAIAGFVPAHRASTIEPMIALRTE